MQMHEQVEKEYRKFRDSWLIALAALGVTVTISDVVLRLPSNSMWRPPLYAVVITPVSLLLIYWFVVRCRHARWAYYGFTTRNGLRNVGIGIVIGSVAVAVAASIIHIQFGHWPKPAEDTFLYLLASVLSAPIWEELIFRGILFGSMLTLINTKWKDNQRLLALAIAYIVINLLFMITHIGTSNLYVVYYTGFFYVFAFHITGTLITPIVTHATYNLLLEAIALWL